MYEFGDFRIVPEAWDQIDVESLKRMRGAFQMWMSQNLEWLPEDYRRWFIHELSARKRILLRDLFSHFSNIKNIERRVRGNRH